MNIGQNLRKQSEVIDATVVQRGMKDALAGDKTLMTEDEAKAALMTLQASMRKKQEEQVQQMAETNKKEGDAFLAENKTKGGSGDAAERAAVQNSERRHWAETDGCGFGGLQL